MASSASVFCAYCGTRLAAQTSGPVPPTGVSRLQGGVFGETSYIIDRELLALRDTFEVKDASGNLLATVKKEIVSFGPKFWFEAPHRAKLGEVHGKILSMRPNFEVYDASERLVAVIKKKLFSLLSSQWWMEDSAGNEIAKVAGNIWEHDYRVETPADTLIAQIHKKWVSVRDSYCVEITNPEIKPFLVLSYAIAMDHVEDKEHDPLSGRPAIRF